jgi:hypothetical protein
MNTVQVVFSPLYVGKICIFMKYENRIFYIAFFLWTSAVLVTGIRTSDIEAVCAHVLLRSAISIFIFPLQPIFRLLSLHFLLLFSSSSVSLINPSTRVASLCLLPFFFSSSYLFLSSFPSFHCFICFRAYDWLLLIFPWKLNLIPLRQRVCPPVSFWK